MNRPLSLFNIALIAFLCLHHHVLAASRFEDGLESPVIADSAVPKTKPPYTVVVVVILTVVVSVCVSIAYANNYFTGKRENEDLVVAWAQTFGYRGYSVLDKHFNLFSIDGKEDHKLLRKEAKNVFKFYVSGRSMYCHGLLATMELKRRHDLFSRLFNWVRPCNDEISFEVYMNDKAMDHMVFVVARNEAAKTMHQELRDLQRFGRTVPIPSAGRKWVSEELSVISESEKVAADMITDTVLDQVFGDKAFKNLGKYFISMHFSDQLPFKRGKMLLFKFALPDDDHMNDLVPCVGLIPYYIDLLGRYKLDSQARDKTKRARKLAAQNVRQERFFSEKQSLEGNIG